MSSLAVVTFAIVVLVLLVAWARVHPFLAFALVAAAAGMALGMPPDRVVSAVPRGMGDALGGLVIVIVTGAMLGKLVVESGAAQRIADTLVAACGERRMAWAMALTGFIVGIPLFYGVGFVLLVPIIFAVVERYRLPPLVVALPALAALSVAHGLLPPHPAPTALVPKFGADMGRTLLYGILIAVPALVLAGPLFARFLTRVPARPPAGLKGGVVSGARLPGGVVSVVTALLPAVLLLAAAGAGTLAVPGTTAAGIIGFVAKPDVLMLVALLFATFSLGLLRGRSLPAVMDVYTSAIGDVASILLVIAGSGAFKEVLVQTGMDKRIGEALHGLPIDPLIVAWVVTAAIRACVGSATVAGLTAADLVAPLLKDGGTDPNLMVLAIGSGSLAFSHVNDAGFWLFKEYFNLGLVDTLRSWTVMETIVSVAGLAGVLVLSSLI